MKDSVFDWLQGWYLSQCDGDWEHEYGVRIDTLDNPGWAVKIDLAETSLADRTFSPTVQERSPSDWVHCRVENGKFEGFGGPSNLGEILDYFRNWVES